MEKPLLSIPGTEGWLSCEPLTLGWSDDKKYIVRTPDGQTLLLRTAEEQRFPVKQAEYEYLKKVARLPVIASRPVDFGRFEGGVYSLYTWIDGESMEDALPSLSPARQYALGLEAGEALRTLHSLPAPEDTPAWSARMNAKVDRKIKRARECPLEIPGREAMIACIESNRHLLTDRPQTMQHGDYHCGNLVLTPDGHVGVIDFNRFDVGDPWEEFNRIVWCAQRSPAFASGRINGYFPEGVPEEFFPLLAVYILSNQLSSLPWAIPFGQQEIDVMTRQAEEVLLWYDGCTRVIPAWYLSPGEAESLS